jgi:hypothetical protein
MVTPLSMIPGGVTTDSPDGAPSSWWPPGSGEEPARGQAPGPQHDEVEAARVIAKVGWYQTFGKASPAKKRRGLSSRIEKISPSDSPRSRSSGTKSVNR